MAYRKEPTRGGQRYRQLKQAVLTSCNIQFPSAASLIRLVGAVCAEIDEDWSTRRYFQPASLTKLDEEKVVTAMRDPDPELKARAVRIIQVAMESAKDSRRKVA